MVQTADFARMKDPSDAKAVHITLVDRTGRSVRIAARSGFSLMENIRDLDASVEAICGGLCACATCHVWIAPDWVRRLPPRKYEEGVMLRDSAGFDAERSRLSCQIVVTPELQGLTLEVAPAED
jgi:2Fe-2S ferredoxin